MDGLCRALGLTPALTFADWHVKEAVLRKRCYVADDEGHSAVERSDEIPAMLAASLLNDIAALAA
jgi:hypothetical protein